MKNNSLCRSCFYDDNYDAKYNNSWDDHADNPDNQCWMSFIELLRVSWVQ